MAIKPKYERALILGWFAEAGRMIRQGEDSGSEYWDRAVELAEAAGVEVPEKPTQEPKG